MMMVMVVVIVATAAGVVVMIVVMGVVVIVANGQVIVGCEFGVLMAHVSLVLISLVLERVRADARQGRGSRLLLT